MSPLAWTQSALVVIAGLVAGLGLGRALAPTRSGIALAARALILGPAALALIAFTAHCCGAPIAFATVALPGLALGGALLARKRPPTCAAEDASPDLFALVVAACATAALGLGAFELPVVDADEFHNFARNARVFAVEASLAPEMLAGMVDPGRVEYPPLIALNQALLMQAASPSFDAPLRVFSLLAYFAFALLLAEALSSAARRWAARFVYLTAISAPAILSLATDGVADLRLSATVLAIALELRRLRDSSTPARLGLLVALAASAAWTKNEGLPIALGVAGLLVAVGFGAWRPQAARTPRRWPLIHAAALVALCGLWPLWKRLHGIEDFFASKLAAQETLLHVERIPTVLRHFFVDVPLLVRFDGSWAHGALFFVLGACACFAAFRAWTRARFWLLCYALHTGLYAAVFVATPRRFEWHLDTAGYRLALHAVPWLFLLAAIALERGKHKGAPTALDARPR